MLASQKLSKHKAPLIGIDSINSQYIAARAALASIRTAAAGSENLFPLVIDALREDCTLGEIISAMKEEFGTYMAPSGF